VLPTPQLFIGHESRDIPVYKPLF